MTFRAIRACGVAAALAAGVADVARAAEAAGPDAPPVELTVRLKLAEKADLEASDVTFAPFPGNRRCAFTYTGPTSYRTIEVLSKLGFRTTVYCSPSAPTEQVQDLEAAGADVGIRIWGGKPTYGSHIGGNTLQEAFDAVVTSRITMRKKCDGPAIAGAVSGHYSTLSFPVNRDPDGGSGFGYAYHDANYLLLSDNKPYMIYLARRGDRQLANRDNSDNRIRSRRVPNELVYYQILANQFRGTLRRVREGQIVRFSLRDFKAPDLAEVRDVLGPFGSHARIWHASESMIGSNEYVRRKVRVKSVAPAGDGSVSVALAVDGDIFPPFVQTPLPLRLPAGVTVRAATCATATCPVTAGEGATCVDVPLGEVLTGPVRMSVRTARADMTIPDRMPLTLSVRNASDRPLRDLNLRWVGSVGLTVTGGAEPFDLAAGAAREVQAEARTVAGARFGIVPFRAVLTDASGRTFMEGFELVAAPRLRVAMHPGRSIPLPAGRAQHFFVDIDNLTSTRPDGRPDTFIGSRAGPCKGTVSFELPAGMEAEPPSQAFELGANEARRLIFRVANSGYSDEPGEMVRPVIRFAGEPEPVHVLFPGTRVIRDKARVAPKALDETGLLVRASWDDRTRGGAFDRSVGNPSPHFFPGHRAAYNNEGVKGWCMNTRRVCQIHDTYRNIDYHEGTACFWVRKDPLARNENTFVGTPEETADMPAGRSNQGEALFLAGCVQNAPESQSGIALRRFRSWKGKDGYLQLTYQMMGRRVVVCQYSPFAWTEEWRHLAILWSVPRRRLELYVDGKLAAKAEAGKEPWRPSPWDRGRPSGWKLQVITSDHGNWTGSSRDEVYIYNRALKPAEIMANRDLVKK